MSRFSAGSMTGDQLIEEFGLQNGGDVGDGFNAGAGASDGNQSKSNKALGEGYLTDETYNKLKNDPKSNAKLKDAYASFFLLYDLIQLSVLLYLTGGIFNPFSFRKFVTILG